MAAKLYKAAEVCDRAQVQPYVLRSWEKEFAGIGVQKGADGPRVYRESDLELVLRIKQLVFGEGLTLAGARRRLEGDPAMVAAAPMAAEPDEPMAVVDGDARRRIGTIREGLRSILMLLEARPSPFTLAGGAPSAAARERSGAQRGIAERSKKQVAVTPAPAVRAAGKAKRASV